MEKQDKVIIGLVVAILVVVVIIAGIYTANNQTAKETKTSNAVSYKLDKESNLKTETKESKKESKKELDETESIVITKEQLEEKLQKGEKMLVDFYAPWCHACNEMKPEIAKAMKENVTIYKVNIDEYREVAIKYGVRYLPTVLSFKDGKEVDRHVGYNDLEGIKKQFNSIK